HHIAQFFTGWRPARLARDLDAVPAAPQVASEPPHMGALARPVDALERDEPAAHQRRPDRCYFVTARSCSPSVREKCEEPSPRETKYRTSLSGVLREASRDARPGMAIGVGGSPTR